jgi:hypothetical protein
LKNFFTLLFFLLYTFFTAGAVISVHAQQIRIRPDVTIWHESVITNNDVHAVNKHQSSVRVRTINGVAVPSDFPEFIVNQYAETAPGRIFLGSTFTNVGNYLMILENDGTPYFYRRFPGGDKGSGEFRVQSNGLLSAYLFGPQYYIIMDHNFVQIDTLKCRHGYTTDAHEMLLLPNGHALFICDDPQQVDMSQLVPGGNPNATVLGNHVQEIDEQDSVVFEWRCWDHFSIADAVHEDLRSSFIDYVHMNAISVDYDGQLIISSRHLSEVTKINHDTGEIIWRFGGVHNQFTYINDPYEFSYQHFVKPVPGKPDHYTIFDNGNFGHPQFSRAVEYKLDTVNMTAEKVWEFRYSPDRYSFMMGSVQRLGNGNTFINWSTWPPGFACEVAPDGRIVYELTINGTAANRIRRFEWEGMLTAPYLIAESYSDGVALIFNKFGDKNVREYIVYAGKSVDQMVPVDTTANTYTVLTELDNLSQYYFKVRAVDENGGYSEFSNMVDVYVKFDISGENLLQNGDFESGLDKWNFILGGQADAQALAQEGELHVQITNGGSDYGDVQLFQEKIALVQGKTYQFGFDAHADANKTIVPMVKQSGDGLINYSRTSAMVIRLQKRHFQFEFTMTDPSDDNARVVFNCGQSDIGCYFDNVFVRENVQSGISNSHVDDSSYQLFQNYPNPFNPVTFIHFSVPELSLVTIKIYNLLGERVSELVNRKYEAGNYTATFDASRVGSGIYLYEMNILPMNGGRSFRYVKKMTVVK